MAPIAWTAFLLAALLVLAACGGDDDGTDLGPTEPGPLVCDALRTQAYRYSVNAITSVSEPASTPEPADPPPQGPAPFTFSETLTGEIDRDGDIHVSQTNTDGVSVTEYEIIELEDRGFQNFGDGWREQDTSVRPVPVRYRPYLICEALVGEIDTSQLGGGRAEDVNGVPSQKFELRGHETQFFAREPDFGSRSDAANLLKVVDADVWVATNGNYLTRLRLTGIGEYPNGNILTIELSFDTWDMGASIRVDSPS